MVGWVGGEGGVRFVRACVLVGGGESRKAGSCWCTLSQCTRLCASGSEKHKECLCVFVSNTQAVRKKKRVCSQPNRTCMY